MRRSGYVRSTCVSCPCAIWLKEEDEQRPGTQCGACRFVELLSHDCVICRDKGPSCDLFMNHCHSKYCQACIGQWICTQIDEGISNLTCPTPGCSHSLQPMVKNLASRRFVSKAHVSRLRELQNAGRYSFLEHVLSGADPNLLAWASNNLQSCPHCLAVIQKSAGCNHITCQCGGEFCYVCGEAYPLPSSHTHRPNEGPTLNTRGVEVMPATIPPSPPALTMLAPAPGHATTAAISSSPRSAEAARTRLAELLTLRCPTCAVAVHMDATFDQCFSLRCAACPTHFCAWCFRPAAEGEDPHTHVLDCEYAPSDMRGSALYLQDTNGGPHVPPRPHAKFVAHWRAAARQALEMIECAADGSFDKAALVRELDEMMHGGESHQCTECGE